MAYHKGDRSSAQFAFLKTHGYVGTINDKLLAWLQHNGATANQLNDAWMQFLAAEGFAVGTLSDRKFAYFKSLGLDVIAGSSNSDMEREYWAGGYGPT